MQSQPSLNNNTLPGTLQEEKSVKKKASQDYKDQVIAVYKSGVYPSVAACAEAYGVNAKTLHGWLKIYEKRTTPIATSEQQAENIRLKKELARAKMELEILKKAAIYFANHAQ